ncbi:YpjP family protein [Bacillus sp. FJAT-44742]|uniref:YpjP family protein n=1 Tax=Bacillus sp. FJAT-44742 TaxID=2014005 RepID=UPI000C23D6A6|nr:YpjP family protein [Bacillus sp. FJAT-44742]
MKLWFKKISVILITFMTLGVYIPPTYLDSSSSASAKEEKSGSDEQHYSAAEIEEYSEIIAQDYEENIEVLDDEHFIDIIVEQAKEQSVKKLGPKILKQVEADFMTDILPSIENVLKDLVEEAGMEESKSYVITEEPSQGSGEKIFNVYDDKNKKDIAKFHVRRDLRPKEGYWFNFHYHLHEDNFEEHHQIGDVYWDKNTPPKWMT